MKTNTTQAIAIAAILTMCGCASSPEAHNRPANRERVAEKQELTFDQRLSQLKLGMSKQQVVAIMGDNYVPEGETQTAHGSIECLRFMPSFGHRYATALKREYSFGFAGQRDTNGVVLQMKDGRLESIHRF